MYYQRKLKTMWRGYVAGEFSFEQLTSSVQGWINYARYGNTIGLQKAVLGGLVIPSN